MAAEIPENHTFLSLSPEVIEKDIGHFEKYREVEIERITSRYKSKDDQACNDMSQASSPANAKP
jgi:hypothetical protein